MKRTLLVLAATASLSAAALPGAEIIPADRLADWRPGDVVGVASGIPERTNRIDVTRPPYDADNTGAQDAHPAIQKAIAAAAENDVVYLPAGRYRIDKALAVGCTSRITIRGAGPEKTFILGHHPTGGAIQVGSGGADWWYEERLKIDIAASPSRGATVLTVGDTTPLDRFPEGGIGQLCQLSLKNDPALPVIVPANFDYMRRQVSRIVAKTATTVTIAPGLLFDLPSALSPRLAPAGGRAEFVGIEDLTVDGSNSRTPHGLIHLTACYGCWVRNVSVRNAPNYHVSVSDSARCEVRHCHVAKRMGEGSNGAGFLVGTSSFCLFEDNIIGEQFPHIEVNGSSGNVSPKFQSDGYHGSSSHDTAFRNWFQGTDVRADKFGICVNLNRFTRFYSIVGNVLRAGHAWLYDNAENGLGYDERYIYAFGLPNMGNGGFSGKAQPSKGKDWADWPRMLGSERGKGPGPSGFQELDLDVKATTLLKGNYNYRDRGVPASESLGGVALPESLYLKEKPAWFGDLPWPPFGPDTDFEKNKIPAQVRFEAMEKAERGA